MSKGFYETPVTVVMMVNFESGLLTISSQGVEGNRSGYGTALLDSWD